MRKKLNIKKDQKQKDHGVEQILDVIDASTKRLLTPTALFVTAYFVSIAQPKESLQSLLFSVLLGALVVSGLAFIIASWNSSLDKLQALQASKVAKNTTIVLHGICHLFVALVAVAQALSKLPVT